MTNRVGSYHAKTHFAELLDRVQKGEEVVVTRRGEPVAVMIPFTEVGPPTVTSVAATLRAFRNSHPLGRTSVRDLVQDARSP